MTKSKFYSLKKILAKNAQYNIIFGERSNGKTYACLEYGLTDFVKNGNEFALVRRWKEDIRGRRGQVMFDALVANNVVSKLTKGEFDKVSFKNGKWFLAKYDDMLDKDVLDSKPFCTAFALSDYEHDKSTSYPNIKTVVFDEFITRGLYQVDEFVVFMNVLSTIIRDRDNVKIFMLGNTVNKFCPYFSEMGLKHILDMPQGTIDVYTYGDSNLKVAVEYADNVNKNKASNVYFAFDNPKLNMITKGNWEIPSYPHLPFKYDKKDILFTFFICFESNVIQCEIVYKNDTVFCYAHIKTTPLKDTSNDLIYSVIANPNPNYAVDVLSPTNDIQRKVSKFFSEGKIFYQNNEVGEIVRNYMLVAKSQKVIRS